MLRPCCGLPHYGQRRCYAFLDVYLKRGIGQRQGVAAGLVAIGVIGEGGVDDAARDRRHRMREGPPRRRVAVMLTPNLENKLPIGFVVYGRQWPPVEIVASERFRLKDGFHSRG